MINRIQKIKTLEEKILVLKKEAAADLKKRIKQKEKGILKLGQEFAQTFEGDFHFKISVKKNHKNNISKPSTGRARLTKDDKIKVENQIRNILKDIKGLKKKGSKRNTTYSLK